MARLSKAFGGVGCTAWKDPDWGRQAVPRVGPVGAPVGRSEKLGRIHRLNCGYGIRVVEHSHGQGNRRGNNIRVRQMRSGQIRDGARPMRIERRNTTSGQSPYAGIDFRLTTSEIRNPDGSIVFRLENVEVPQFWSQVASDVLAQKYFRKAGVAARLKKVEEETVPSWLWRSV